jgi:hypothetical protein
MRSQTERRVPAAMLAAFHQAVSSRSRRLYRLDQVLFRIHRHFGMDRNQSYHKPYDV